MAKNCHNCKHALEFRDHMREGEQARCGLAEELFGKNVSGGKRWVNMAKSEKTGELINSPCGKWESFVEDLAKSAVPVTSNKNSPVVKVTCDTCKGSGVITVRVMSSSKLSPCTKCKGTGRLEV